MACSFCTGTHWLNDTPGLGPCVCCTPDAVTQLEADHAETLGQIADALAAYFVSIGMSANPVVVADDNLRTIWELAR